MLSATGCREVQTETAERRRCARGPASDPFRDSGSLEGTLGSREHRKRPTFPAPCPSLPRDSIPSVFLWSPESSSFWTSLCTSAVERPTWCLLTSARPVPRPLGSPALQSARRPGCGIAATPAWALLEPRSSQRLRAVRGAGRVHSPHTACPPRPSSAARGVTGLSTSWTPPRGQVEKP